MEEVLPYQFEPEFSESDSEGFREGDPRDISEPSSQHEQRVGNTDWCRCGGCITMETERECFCCEEYHELGDKMYFITCVTENTSFTTVCLDSEVLGPALVYMAQTTGESYPDPPTHSWDLSKAIL